MARANGQVYGQVSDQVWGRVEDQVRGQVEGQVWGAVNGRPVNRALLSELCFLVERAVGV
jgi:hypothetical protein